MPIEQDVSHLVEIGDLCIRQGVEQEGVTFEDREIIARSVGVKERRSVRDLRAQVNVHVFDLLLWREITGPLDDRLIRTDVYDLSIWRVIDNRGPQGIAPGPNRLSEGNSQRTRSYSLRLASHA